MTSTTISSVRTYLAWLAEQVADPIAKVLLDHGREMPEVVKDGIDMGELGSCYETATERSVEFSLDYVEGYATGQSGIPLAHAWCIDADGNVYDPTWPDGTQYLGVVIPTPVLARVLGKTEVYGVLVNLWRLEISEARQVLADIGDFQAEWWSGIDG